MMFHFTLSLLDYSPQTSLQFNFFSYLNECFWSLFSQRKKEDQGYCFSFNRSICLRGEYLHQRKHGQFQSESMQKEGVGKWFHKSLTTEEGAGMLIQDQTVDLRFQTATEGVYLSKDSLSLIPRQQSAGRQGGNAINTSAGQQPSTPRHHQSSRPWRKDLLPRGFQRRLVSKLIEMAG